MYLYCPYKYVLIDHMEKLNSNILKIGGHMCCDGN